MRIISKFKDYYDIHPNERGDEPIYVRKTETQIIRDRREEELRAKTKKELQQVKSFYRHTDLLFGKSYRMPDHPGYNGRRDYRHLHQDHGVIAFCGKAHPFYWINNKACFTIEQVTQAYEALIERDFNDQWGKEILKTLHSDSVKKWTRYGGRQLTCGNWEKYLEEKDGEFQSLTQVSADTHLYFNAPVIYIGSGSYIGKGNQFMVVTNPCLNMFNFASQVDPYTAYQELDMFIGNTLTVTESSDLVMTEKLKVHSKGMDKWSFRTMPGDSSKAKKRRSKQND